MKRFAWLGLLVTSSTWGQGPIIPVNVPPAQRGPSPIIPASPQTLPPPGQQMPAPNQLPPGVTMPGHQQQPVPPSQAILPRAEGLFKMEPNQLQVRRLPETTQVWQRGAIFRDFGKFDREAEDVVNYLRTARPAEWATIGTPRPVVEYGLFDGEALKYSPVPRWGMRMDLVSLRTENIRGAWVLRDDRNILLNFGPQREEAEQAHGVARKYGFNALGMIGFPVAQMTYFYKSQAPLHPNEQKLDTQAMLSAMAQEQNLNRTGIPVPGIGYVGERLQFDPRKVELRRERNEYVLAHGVDVLAKFGQNDWLGRDAQRMIQECRFTELCTYGGAGVAFFLVNGQAPTRVPYFVQGTRFDSKLLKVRPTEVGRFGLFEPGGRQILPAANQAEAEVLLKMVQHFQFDTLCTMGNSPSGTLKFLAKTGAR